MAEAIKTVGELAGICGHDGTNWEKILIDASKRLVVAIDTFAASLEVTQDTPGDLLAGVCGYDGTTWRRAGLPLWYNNTLSENIFDTSIAAGTVLLPGTAGATGELWVVTTLSGRCVSATISQLQLGAVVSGNAVYAMSVVPPVSGQFYATVCNVVLKQGDYMFARVVGATLNDDLYLNYCGYRVKLVI